MAWKELAVSEQRFALVHRIKLLKRPLAEVAREFGVSRKTAYKWLARYEPGAEASTLSDRSRRPHRSPLRTEAAIEQEVLALRQQYRWGPRKIHRVLCDRKLSMPSQRTVASILSRRGCIGAVEKTEAFSPQMFERATPNELWQIDHKGPVEVARQKVMPLTILDDHSRYCLRFEPLTDVTMASVWNVLWDLCGEVGMPSAILCDNAFGGTCLSLGLSWFDARLVRLGINPIHGRPYHPQTQGKVERLHGTVMRELIDFDARRGCLDHFAADCQRWRMTYNTLRPHEALGDLPPVVRWKPSERVRPATLPPVNYPADAVIRHVSHAGNFRYHNARILVGRGLSRQLVRIEERDHDIAVYYAWKQVRVIPHALLGGPRSDKMI
jgi:transposase InsO family protein